MGEKLQKKRVGKTQRKREKQREDEEKETERVSKANPTYKCGLIQTNKLKREKKRIGDF